jgi:hypothetical protein
MSFFKASNTIRLFFGHGPVREAKEQRSLGQSVKTNETMSPLGAILLF